MWTDNTFTKSVKKKLCVSVPLWGIVCPLVLGLQRDPLSQVVGEMQMSHP